MKKLSKNTLALLLAATLMLGVFPISGLAVEGNDSATPSSITESPAPTPEITPVPAVTPAAPSPTPASTSSLSELSGEELYQYLLALDGEALLETLKTLTCEQYALMIDAVPEAAKQIAEWHRAIHQSEFAEKEYGTPQGLFVDGRMLYAEELRDHLFGLQDEQAFMDAVNAMDLNQSGSLEGLLTDAQADRISGALRHPGFAADNAAIPQQRSFLRSYEAAAVDQPVWPNPGSILLNKYATKVDGTTNEWQITLTIDGKNIRNTSDVVLVIDKSGSMSGSKMTNTKTAAKAFINQLLPNADSSVRIAIVTFDQSYHDVVSTFTGFAGRQTLLNAIDGLQSGGGTNIQAGIYRARTLLSGSAANKKSIVLLGDGEPTYSQKVTGVSGITYSCHEILWGLLHEFTSINTSNAQITSCNDSTVVGNGSNYQISSASHQYELRCSEHGRTTSTGFPANNGVPTIYEAKLAKDAGYEIFSIALQAGSNGEAVLGSCASTPASSHYFAIANNETDIPGKLQSAFAAIAGSIAYAATNGLVTDPLGDMFDLVGSIQITTSQGSAFVSTDNRTITWNTETIYEGATATMTYRVRLKDTALPDQNYPTNKTTTLQYNNYLGNRTSKDFPIPEVSVTKGVIVIHMYRVNEQGSPINSEGTAVSHPYQAQELGVSYNYVAGGSSALAYGTYDVSAPAVAQYTVYGYVIGTTTNTTGSPAAGSTAPVVVNSATPVRHVYFGYYEVANNCTLTLEKSGWQSTDENASFLFTIVGPSGTFYEVIQGNGSKTIAGLPKGTYTITEEADWSWRYTMSSMTGSALNGATFQNGAVTFTSASGEATVTVTNSRDNPFWLSGESSAVNWFKPTA